MSKLSEIGQDVIDAFLDQLFDYFNLNTDESLQIVDELRQVLEELKEKEK